MKKNDIILITSVVFYTLLLYKQLPGINFLIFNFLLLGFLLWQNIKLIKNLNWILAAIGSLTTAFCISWHGNFLSFLGNIISLSILSGLSFNTKSSLLFSLLFSIYSYFSSIIYKALEYFENRKNFNTEKTENSSPFLKLLLIGVPVIIFIIFFFMYRAANPVFNNFAARLNLDFISFEWIRFTLGGVVLMFGFWYHKEIPFLASTDANATNTIQPDQLGEPTLFGKILGLANENLSGIILLSLLNILLLTVNVLDFEFLFLGGTLPEGLTFSESVHQGIGMLITSIICAILIILYYFRGKLNFYENNKTLRILAYLWVVQNAFMIISTAYRNNLYIDEFSLTYKRIGVYIYLLLALIGLATTLIKIAKAKSNWFLFRKNAWLFYAVLVISCFISWDLMITNFNVARAEKNNKFLDKDYLVNLSYSNIPVLLKMSDTATTFQTESAEMDYIVPEAPADSPSYKVESNEINEAGIFQKQIHNKIYSFLKEQEQTDWRSWSYDRSKTHKEMSKLVESMKIEFVNLSSQNYQTLDPIREFKQLKEIDFSNNQITDLKSLKYFNALKKLNLENNRIDSLSGFPALGNLTSLNISNNNFNDIKPIKNLTKLNELDISDNRNLTFDNKFPLLPQLKTIDVSGNNISDLSFISKLPSLEKLVINNNGDRNFHEIPAHENVKILHISGNNIYSDNFDLRNKIKVFKNLKELDVSENNILYFSYFNVNYKTFQDFAKDTAEIYINNFTPVFPELEVLNISGNNLNSIKGIKNFRKLKKLNLNKTTINSLEPLSELTQLTELEISNNNFSSIEPLRNLINLEYLDLSNNNFRISGNIFTSHQKLTKLNFANCTIGDIKFISDAPALKELDLTNNYLTNIEGIEQLNKLENLNLFGNNIQDLTPVYKLKNLKKLYLNYISDEELAAIKKALPNTTIIRKRK